jgi:hypothetical protein
MCAQFADILLLSAQICHKCVGHAQTKPQPHQDLLAKLPLLWIVDTPAELHQARAPLRTLCGLPCAQG